MATGDKTDLLSSLANNITDNNNKENTPARHRTYASKVITYCLNLVEATKQIVLGPIDFSEQVEFTKPPTHLGSPLVTAADTVEEAPLDGGLYVRRDGEWVQNLSFIATTNSTVVINGSSVTPSFLPIDTIENPVGVEVVTPSEGSIKNISGRLIKTLTGTVSFNPDVSGGATKRVVLVSETLLDGETVWTGNLNSIRKIEIGSSTESFKTNVSLLVNWPVNSQLRFRAYDETGVGVDFTTEAETILGQSFTGASLVWDLSEK